MKKSKEQIYNERLLEKAEIGKYNFSFLKKNTNILASNSKAIRFKTLKLFVRNKAAMVSLVLLILIVLLGLFMPFFTSSPTRLDSSHKHLFPGQEGHLIGTDLAGRDIWARLWHGLRFSLGIAAVATLLDISLGLILGVLMGYSRVFDRIMQFVIKVLSNIPSLFILIIFVLFWNPTFLVLALSMVVSGWIPMAQYARAEVMRYKYKEYTTAELALGASTFSIIKSYIPSLLPIIITQLVFTIPMALQYDASLALIGLAVPNIASIGNMISDSTQSVTIYPLEIIWPLMTMISVIITVQFIGNGIEDSIQKVTYG